VIDPRVRPRDYSCYTRGVLTVQR